MKENDLSRNILQALFLTMPQALACHSATVSGNPSPRMQPWPPRGCSLAHSTAGRIRSQGPSDSLRQKCLSSKSRCVEGPADLVRERRASCVSS